VAFLGLAGKLAEEICGVTLNPFKKIVSPCNADPVAYAGFHARIGAVASRDRQTADPWDSPNYCRDDRTNSSLNRAMAKLHAAYGLQCIAILLDPGCVLHRLGGDLI
jgi:hypothetical protein